jgi:GTP-binding protein
VGLNVVREKKLTNMRASGSDDTVKLPPKENMSLERAIEFIEDDELVEVTPQSIRLRKRVLDEGERIKQRRREKTSV